MKKEAVYSHFLSEARLEHFFKRNIAYCGLTSVFFDRIFLMAYPLICRAVIYENNNNMIERIREQAQSMMQAGLSRFINSIEVCNNTIFNLESHQNNKYGWIDLDSNQLTSLEGCVGACNLIRHCADDRCLVSIWNAVGMKALTFEEQQQFVKEVIVDQLRNEFDVVDDEIAYEDTSLMYVRILKLQRRQ
jgi:hypothetical protein